MKRFAIGVALAASTCALNAQNWTDTGNPLVVPGTNFLGSINAAALDVRTENIRRFTLIPDATYAIGGFPAQVKNGSLLLSPNVDAFYAAGAPGPFTGLHLAAATNNASQQGYRSNMGNGITLTGNKDQMYVGQLFRDLDFTDAAIVWSDNPGEFLADRLTFNFTSSYNAGATSGNSSFRGLQTLLIQPAGSGQEAFVGVGDFDAASATPSERLDILNGRLRIRELPLAANENANLLKYLVTDDNGVVFWRNVPTGGGGGSGCEWTLAPSQNRLSTATAAVGSNGSCPESDWKVGIGTNNTSGKLTVFENALTTGSEFALHVTMNGNTGNNTGHFLRVNDQLSGSLTNTGLDLEVLNGSVNTRGTFIRSVLETGRTSSQDVVCDDLVTTQNGTARDAFGSWARVNLGANSVTRDAYGAYGIVRNYAASGGDSSNVKYMYGVYGEAMGVFDEERFGVYGKAANAPRSWAGYFAGKVYAQNGYFTSDAQLKTNIEELTNCNDVIAQLRPRKYNFNMAAWPGMGLPEGMQTGLIAQDLQEVLPHLVDMAHHPAERDDEGNLTSEGVDFLAVNYIGLMPYLIGAIQEQHQEIAVTEATNAALTDRLAEQDARMEEQARRLDQLEAALAACCAATPGDTRLLTTPPANTPDDLNKALEGDARHLHIQPNPFTERTTLHYRLERAGRMQLLANSADGKALKVLQEATLEAGAYQFNWETNELTPGVYYVTLLLDGEPLVKKAVKVMR